MDSPWPLPDHSSVLRTNLPSCFTVTSFNSIVVGAQVLRGRSFSKSVNFKVIKAIKILLIMEHRRLTSLGVSVKASTPRVSSPSYS